ncbi:MAG: Flp pilus assembly complex ATPase component TadA [Elusimicrobia bacterium]|nr:Flp pilus assembly complex ATPase component TadA [Elusimicrobiota bacterium]
MPSARPVRAEFLLAELDSMIAEDAPPVIEGAATRLPKVLVVDDNKDYRGVVCRLLEKNGHEVIEALDGAEGLRLALAEQPDLVVLDFDLPLLNGYELLLQLRGDFDLRKVPVVMLAGKGRRGLMKELPLYVSAFLEKPVSSHRLLEAVQGLLGRSPAGEAGRHEIVLGPRPGAAVRPAGDAQEEPEAAGGVLVEDANADDADPESSPEIQAQDSSLIDHVNRLLLRAVDLGASDIHIEPQENEIAVRVRLNGSLNPLCSFPSSLGARLTARIKIISNLVITERRRPQDGQFRMTAQGRKIEFRVSILPSMHGEKIVMRVLGTGQKTALSEIGFNPRDLECVEKAVQSQNGLILVTGPTGSGKTTTLYSMIAMLNKPDVNIMTAEDPVEYLVPGITQVHVKPAIGLTFEAVLRSLLRQDPDIMLIGEIRDLETAEIAVKASITGHLVLSTLHTNSAPSAIMRLTQMGIKPYLAAASLRMVIALRLLKLLCPRCKLQVPLSDAEKRILAEAELASMTEIYRGVGCADCGQTGYAGRRPIFEVMPIGTSAMRHLILSSNDGEAMAELAAQEGMSSLRRSALKMAASGETSLSEALKIVLSE